MKNVSLRLQTTSKNIQLLVFFSRKYDINFSRYFKKNVCKSIEQLFAHTDRRLKYYSYSVGRDIFMIYNIFIQLMCYIPLTF